MASSKLDRIEKLLRLGLGAGTDEEARTSLALALKLAGEVGCVIRVAPAAGGKSAEISVSAHEPGAFKSGKKRPSAYYDPGSERSERPRRRRTRVYEGRVVGERPPPDEDDDAPFVWSTEFKNFQATNTGVCRLCGERWTIGEILASSDPSSVAFHAGCVARRGL